MRIIDRAVLFLVAIFLILFALSNRSAVSVGFWPLPFLADVPLYLLCFLCALVGAAVGAARAWFAGGGDRRELRDRRRRIAALERELAATQARLENLSETPRTALARTEN